MNSAPRLTAPASSAPEKKPGPSETQGLEAWRGRRGLGSGQAHSNCCGVTFEKSLSLLYLSFLTVKYGTLAGFPKNVVANDRNPWAEGIE